MKKILFSLYIFFCTGGTYAQDRKNNIVAEIDFNRPAQLVFKADTVRATFLITRGRMQIAHSYEGYAIIKGRDTVYLDDRKRVLKAPVTVWSTKIKTQ
jgi:hypothetical protein